MTTHIQLALAITVEGVVHVGPPRWYPREQANVVIQDFMNSGADQPPPPVEISTDDAVSHLLREANALPAQAPTRAPRAPKADTEKPAEEDRSPRKPAVDLTSQEAIKAAVIATRALASGATNVSAEKLAKILSGSTISRIKTGAIPAGPMQDAIRHAWNEVNRETNPYPPPGMVTDDGADLPSGEDIEAEVNNNEADDPRDAPQRTAAELAADPSYAPSQYPKPAPQPELSATSAPAAASTPWGKRADG